ncbi:MAG TPA: metabolite traffic protein EboE [Candidatus Azoamicus sp. OHIO1]
MIINNQHKYNLTYCLNVFKSKNWEETLYNIKIFVSNIKKTYPNKEIGIGLCISNSISKELIKKRNLLDLIILIKNENIYIPSINGFVYKKFHQKSIKDKIYIPEWTSNSRILYTKLLIKILKELLPKNVNGSITTLPISYKPWINKKNKTYIFYKSSINISKIIDILININKKYKKLIHLDIEPEPNCLIENSKEIVRFYKLWLLPIGSDYLRNKYNIEKKIAIALIKDHIKICYDICHFSTNFEKTTTIIKLLTKEKIKIGRIQISSAIKIKTPKKKEKFKKIINKISHLSYSPFLHQTVEKNNNQIKKFIDIKYAIKTIKKNKKSEWRIHCHLPIYLKKYSILETTNKDTKSVLKNLINNKITNHIEIETYTYNVISPNSDIMASIIKEYNWVIEILETK